MQHTFHKFNDTDRKYSKYIAEHLRKQKDFKEENNLDKYFWSDKNTKSVLQDYYPYNVTSIVDKQCLYLLFPELIPPTYTKYNTNTFKSFIKNDSNVVYYLKPSSKYIGHANGIKISKNPIELCEIFKKEKNIIIQKEVKPKLIDGYKYDIRVYVLIVYNKNIVHIYIYPGILRFCKKKYTSGSTDIDEQITIHGKFEKMTSTNNEIKTIIYLTSLTYIPQSSTVGYQYLGYDIIIDENNKYYLLEVNIQPSLERIHYSIIKDFSKLIARPILTNKGYFPFISSNGEVLLSDLNITQLSDLYQITKNHNIMKYIGNLKIWDLEKTKRFIEYDNNKDYYNKAIVLQSTKKLIGIIGKHKNKLTIYFNENCIGKGYGKQALELFLFSTEGKLEADVLENNNYSLQFFKKYSSTKINNIYRFNIR
jgi:hypothetical protein